MPHTSVDVRDECGLVLAESSDPADMPHRWWFDVTEEGRLVFVGEVVDVGVGGNSRHYVEGEDAAVPDSIRAELRDEGYEMIVDTSGREL